MAILKSISIENYRSIQGPIEINFPTQQPVVLLGENNAGKSNIVKAINLLLGSFWPGNHEPEDHEFYGRNRDTEVRIVGRFDDAQPLGRYRDIRWRYDPDEGIVDFKGCQDHSGDYSGWIRADDRDHCVCVLLEAERNLNYQLSYSSKYTFLSKLMHKFHKTLSKQVDTMAELEQLFQQIKDKFQEIPEFTAFSKHLQQQLGDFLGTMTHKLEVDFEAYNPSNFFHALRLHAQQDGLPRTLDEMGTGEEQILALSFAYAFAQAFHGGIILVVEEPEAHLHPLAQEWLANRLGKMNKGGLQMILTTHSPSFLNILDLEGLVLVSKGSSGTTIQQMSRQDLVSHCLSLGANENKTKVSTILPFYKASSTKQILEGFFAKGVVLVEGPTEFLSLPELFRQTGFDHAREGLAIIPVHGKGSIAKWYRLFTAFDIPTYVIFDNDEDDDRDGTKRIDALTTLGLPIDRAEPLLEVTDWCAFDSFCVIGVDYETSLRNAFDGYKELEERAKERGIDNKPFVDRYAAERLTLDKSSGWEVLGELTQNLATLLQS